MTTDLKREECEVFEAALEGFFEEAGMEAQADVVALVLARDSDDEGPDRVAGIPGAAVLGLAPIVVEWFFALLRAFLEQLQKNAIEDGSKSIIARLTGWIAGREKKRRTPFRRLDVSNHLDTIADIARTLEDAGWPREKVRKAAEDLWALSDSAAKRVVGKK